MFRFAKWLLGVAVFAGVVMLGTANSARASLELQLSSGSTTKTVKTGDQGPAGYSSFLSGEVGAFNVVASFGFSNGPGGAYALAQQGTFLLTNTSSLAQTITIKVSAQDFTSPTSPPPVMLSDTIAGSVANGSLISGSANAYADANNTLFGQGFSDSGLDLTNLSTGSFQSFAANGTAVNGFNTASTGAPYSLTFVETFTLSAGASLTLNYGNVVTLPQSVEALPEPTTMMAAFTAVPFLGLGAWLRRRKQII